MPKEPLSLSLEPAAYEHSDVSGKLAGAIALGLATAILVLPFLLRAVYPNAYDGEGAVRYRAGGTGPHLQIDEVADLATLRHGEDVRLQSYGWTDRNGGRVRIPIDRAMALTAQRGLPGWPKP